MKSNWRIFDTAESHYVLSTDEEGLRLHVRSHHNVDGAPVLFVHGATFPGRSFDVPYPGASWLRACQAAGHSAYAMDIRGYGRSLSARMLETTKPYGRARDAIKDISDVIDWLQQRHNGRQIFLVGSSWGSITTSLFTSAGRQQKVCGLILYAPIYGEKNDGWIDLLADPADRSRFNPAWGAFRLIDETQIRVRGDFEIPSDKIADWRDEEIYQTSIDSSLAEDPTSSDHNPPAFRAPNGTLQDLWSCFTGRPIFQPGAITCPSLLIRGSADVTSTRRDALQLFDKLGTGEKRYIEIANGSHFLSAERNAWQVFDETNAFISSILARQR